MRILLKYRFAFLFVLFIIMSLPFLYSKCMTESKEESISVIINDTDWSHDYSGQDFSRIKSIVSTQKGLNELYNLLDSNDEFTVINTAVLIRLLSVSGYLDAPRIPRVISALTRIISRADSKHKAEAIMALDNITNNYIISLAQDRILDEKLTDKDITLINEIIDSLIFALHDENDQIQVFSAHSLFRYGSYAIRAEPELANLLENEAMEVRLSAAATIGYINPETSIDVVAVMLEGLRNYDRNSLKINAVTALVKMDDSSQDVIDTLMYLIETGDEVLRDTAIDALIKLHPEPENIITQLNRLLSSEDDNIRYGANRILLEYRNEAEDE